MDGEMTSMDGEVSSMDGEMSSMDGEMPSMDVIHGWKCHSWMSSMGDSSNHGYHPWMKTMDDRHGQSIFQDNFSLWPFLQVVLLAP